MNKHQDFILSPIIDILKDVAAANAGIGDGIETYPLSEYILQSAFLKMTGFQEQKMKCICWELATHDYEYRYKRYTQEPIGECSSYKDKNKIYKDILSLIKKNKPTYDVATEIDRPNIRRNTISELRTLLSTSNLRNWMHSNVAEFNGNASFIPQNQFATADDLLVNILQDKYELLYKHRNRCAHNTLSYQENLPTLRTLYGTNYKDDNYFVRFALLSLIDKIFIDLYKNYQNILSET